MFLFKSELNLNTCTYLLSLMIVIEILLNILFIPEIKILPNTHNYLTSRNQILVIIMLIGFRSLNLLQPLNQTFFMETISSVGVNG